MSRIGIRPLIEENKTMAVTGELLIKRDTGHVTVIDDSGKEVSKTKDLEVYSRQGAGGFAFGNQDWTRMAVALNGSSISNLSYDPALKGVKVTGITWFKIRVQMPVDPISTYYAKVRIKKIDGTGTFYTGADSLNENFSSIATDQASSYNYFVASSVTPVTGTSTEYEGTISGYNLPSESARSKFDPDAKYFDLMFLCNYGGAGTTLIEYVEIYRAPNTAYVGSNKVLHQGFLDNAMDRRGTAMTGGFLTLFQNPTNALHAATKQYVDAVKQALWIKDPVRVATTSNITLSAPQTIDGVAVIEGDRVLVKDQTTGSQNGIYTVAAGAWTRSIDCDESAEVTSGFYVFVEEGSASGDASYVLTTDGTITIGTTSLAFVQFSGAGQIVSGTGLTKTGNTLNVIGTANRITANADSIDIASTYVGQTSITTLGTIGTGLWQGSIVGTLYGGTGSNNGSITGSSALTFAAGGSNQNVTITPSGTGNTLLNGKVGLGTTTPSKKLHIVAGSEHAVMIENNGNYWDMLFKVQDGAVDKRIWGLGAIGTVSADFVIGTGNDIVSPAKELFRITQSGNVGIDVAAPISKLDILTTAGLPGLHISAPDDATPNIILDTAGTDRGRITTTSQGLLFQSPSPLWDRADLFIKNTGDVAIGNTDVIPVFGSAAFFAGKAPRFEVLSGTSAGTYEEFISMRHQANDATAVTRRLGLLFNMSTEANATESAKMGGMILDSSSASAGTPSLSLMTSNAKRMTILADGKVGIGTTVPLRMLDIAGDIRVTNSIYSNAASMNFLTDAGGALPIKVGSLAISGSYSVTAPTNGLYVQGSIGVGIATPGTLLHIQGVNDTSLTTHGLAIFGTITSSNISLDDNEIMARNNGVVSTLSINDLGGNVIVSQNGSGNLGVGIVPTEKIHAAGNILATGQLKSTVATGTAPLTVNSTTKVTNLNADLFDDLNSTQFARTDVVETFDQTVTMTKTMKADDGVDFGGGFTMKFNPRTGSLDIVTA